MVEPCGLSRDCRLHSRINGQTLFKLRWVPLNREPHRQSHTPMSSSATLMSVNNKVEASPDIVAAPISADNARDSGYDEKLVQEAGMTEKVEMIDGRPRDIYDRTPKSQKNRTVAIVSYSAFSRTSPKFQLRHSRLPVFSCRAFRLPAQYPPIPQMISELHSSPAVIDYTVTSTFSPLASRHSSGPLVRVLRAETSLPCEYTDHGGRQYRSGT